MNLNGLDKILESQPKYRLEQIKKAVFVDLIGNWDEATSLSMELRAELNKKCPLGISVEVIESKDKKTVKALIELEDGLKIETVLMRYGKDDKQQNLPFDDARGINFADRKYRNTVCVSSQVGCALNCSFCATGNMGFKRNLSVEEIIEQVLFFARYLEEKRDKITNIVFMGMGEPFLNYDNVISAIKILNDQKGFNLGARHFSISTVGIVEGIKKLANEPLQINLAISFHAPNDRLRSQIIPTNKKYPIKKILKAVDNYIKKTNRKVMFEYIMIKDLNDSEKQAVELAKLMRKPLFHSAAKQRNEKTVGLHFVNLIPCNLVGDFKPSPQEKIEKFKKILKAAGAQVNQRYSFGQDIKAACGQLAGGGA